MTKDKKGLLLILKLYYLYILFTKTLKYLKTWKLQNDGQTQQTQRKMQQHDFIITEYMNRRKRKLIINKY